jgi:uncharacterized protein (DUF169 family)
LTNPEFIIQAKSSFSIENKGQKKKMTTQSYSSYAKAGEQLRSILDLETSAVGVSLIDDDRPLTESYSPLQQHRYCQALMKARHGEKVSLNREGIACPAAAAAFGFKALPEALRTGQGLVGFGIVQNPSVGKRMFEQMPRIEPGKIQRIELFPLEQADQNPDIIVIEGNIEQLMWVNLAYLNVMDGDRLTGSTAVLQATCVDATIIPFMEQRLNFGFGCYGCREATDMERSESVVGFPVKLLNSLVIQLAHLSQKAMPNSRQKRAYQNLQNRQVI